MEKEQRKYLEPFFNHWYLCEEGLLGEGSFGSVYKVKREEFENVQYSACKIISIPNSQGEISQLESTGMTKEEIQNYYDSVVREIYKEIACMSKLKGKSTIISYEDHEIRKRADGIGYDIFIRMELAESLTGYSKKKELSVEEILKMGKDLCQALILCENHHILHRDIKPDNIFVSKDGEFKLGDFGIARAAKEYQIGLSVKGSYEYMAPEVYSGKKYDHRVDIYSLGIVLYTYLNQKRIPFLNEKQENITYQERKKALQKRLSGENIIPIEGIPLELGQAVYKAMAYDPKERFRHAKDFLEALEYAEKQMLLQKNLARTLPMDLDATVVMDFGTPQKKAYGVAESFSIKEKNIREVDEGGKRQQKKKKEIEKREHFLSGNRKKTVRYLVVFGVLTIGILGVLNEGKLKKRMNRVEIQEISVQQQSIPKHNVQELNNFQVVDVATMSAVIESSVENNAESKLETVPPCAGNVVSQGGIKKKPLKTHSPNAVKTTKAPKTTKGLETAQTSKEESGRTEKKTEKITGTPGVVFAKQLQLPSGITMTVGGSVRLPLVCNPQNAQVIIRSGDEEVVVVKGTTLYAKKNGEGIIVVTSGDCIATCKVFVTKE